VLTLAPVVWVPETLSQVRDQEFALMQRCRCRCTAVGTVENTERMNTRRPYAADTTNHLVARVPAERPTSPVCVRSGSPARAWRAVSRDIGGESLPVALLVRPLGSLAELHDSGAETGQEHNNAGGSGQEETRACVRAHVGADDLCDDDVHAFIVLAPSVVFYWGCPGADPENPEIVSGSALATMAMPLKRCRLRALGDSDRAGARS
jgi:hypothetical protein